MTSPEIAIVLAVWRIVALVAFPSSDPVIDPAEKLPDASRDTMALAVLLLVAVVALLDTFPAVDIVASLVSTIPAVALISAFTMEPAVIADAMLMSEDPLNDVAVPVTSPEIAIVLAVWRIVAVPALPVMFPVTLPTTLPVTLPVRLPVTFPVKGPTNEP